MIVKKLYNIKVYLNDKEELQDTFMICKLALETI